MFNVSCGVRGGGWCHFLVWENAPKQELCIRTWPFFNLLFFFSKNAPTGPITSYCIRRKLVFLPVLGQNAMKHIINLVIPLLALLFYIIFSSPLFLGWRRCFCIITLHPPTYITCKNPRVGGINADPQSKRLILRHSSKEVSCFVIPYIEAIT